MLMANDSRKPSSTMDAESILKNVTGMFDTDKYLQIGGNETVGMGWCNVSVVPAPEGGA
jgi:CRISPR-associated protein Cmr4